MINPIKCWTILSLLSQQEHFGLPKNTPKFVVQRGLKKIKEKNENEGKEGEHMQMRARAHTHTSG